MRESRNGTRQPQLRKASSESDVWNAADGTQSYKLCQRRSKTPHETVERSGTSTLVHTESSPEKGFVEPDGSIPQILRDLRAKLEQLPACGVFERETLGMQPETAVRNRITV